MGWYRDLTKILAKEPEAWLSYLHGQCLDKIPRLTEEKPKYRGLLLQIAIFSVLLIRKLKIKKIKKLNSHAKYFVFAGTANQLSSLNQTIDSLVKENERVVSIANSKLLNNDNEKRYIPFQLTIIDGVRIVWLFITRWPVLYSTLRAKSSISIDWHLSNFCSVYIYLVYFYRILTSIKPEFVITANDHNPENRCLLAVAHHLSISTVYLQHASVSPIFPALRVSYAFLDGQYALDIYRQCEANKPQTSVCLPVPQVILSGQKKKLRKSDITKRNVVGVALNTLDHADATIKFVNSLASNGINIRLRWHPGQAASDVTLYRRIIRRQPLITLSDPLQEPVHLYLEQIGWLVSGNSSIHLEAALSGVIPIYYEFSPASHPDYYGYVKHGVARSIQSASELLEILREVDTDYFPDSIAIRYYSSTYQTEWEGREGQLVAECLQRISEDRELPVMHERNEFTKH
jgi:hypothetical protein